MLRQPFEVSNAVLPRVNLRALGALFRAHRSQLTWATGPSVPECSYIHRRSSDVQASKRPCHAATYPLFPRRKGPAVSETPREAPLATGPRQKYPTMCNCTLQCCPGNAEKVGVLDWQSAMGCTSRRFRQIPAYCGGSCRNTGALQPSLLRDLNHPIESWAGRLAPTTCLRCQWLEGALGCRIRTPRLQQLDSSSAFSADLVCLVTRRGRACGVAAVFCQPQCKPQYNDCRSQIERPGAHVCMSELQVGSGYVWRTKQQNVKARGNMKCSLSRCAPSCGRAPKTLWDLSERVLGQLLRFSFARTLWRGRSLFSSRHSIQVIFATPYAM
jgi:hypothetical protein